MTYLERYQEHLETVIGAGGDSALVEKTVDEFNHIENPGWAASEPFKEWAKQAALTCSSCQAACAGYYGQTPRDEICCTTCLSHSTTTAGGAHVAEEDGARQDP